MAYYSTSPPVVNPPPAGPHPAALPLGEGHCAEASRKLGASGKLDRRARRKMRRILLDRELLVDLVDVDPLAPAVGAEAEVDHRRQRVHNQHEEHRRAVLPADT